MNRQDLIKEYKEYGFSEAEISAELGIPLFLIKSALVKDKPSRTDIKAKSLRYKNVAYDKMQANDRTLALYELLYEYHPLELNKLLKNMGANFTAKYTGYTVNDIIALKMHFGYKGSIPKDALHKICYFSEKIRREVDKRDNRQCIRCNKDLTVKSIRYHKISHPDEMVADNCATLCLYCRSHRILKHYDHDRERFMGMRYEEFKTWIADNDPFHHRNRVYPPGQVGTWNK